MDEDTKHKLYKYLLYMRQEGWIYGRTQIDDDAEEILRILEHYMKEAVHE